MVVVYLICMKLVKTKNGKKYAKEIQLLDEEKIKNLGPKTLKVLKQVAKEKSYPKKISESLDMHEQKIYYHIRKLKEADLVEVYDEKSIGGANCKLYRPTAWAFGFSLPNGWRKAKTGYFETSEKLVDFFSEFIEGGSFSGSIVAGSPKQHGPFMTSARDGHYAVQLGIFLGDFCDLEDRFVVKLDTEVKAEGALDRHLMLIGGPITNIVSREINDELSVRFDWEETWKIVSDRTGKVYKEDNLGIIAKIENNGFSRILFSGLDFKGTKTCIIGITQQYEKILGDYQPDKEFYRVIKGLDRDGDGKTDDIEILE